MEDANEEKTKRQNIRVVSVQKGPYRSAGVRCVVRKEDLDGMRVE